MQILRLVMICYSMLTMAAAATTRRLLQEQLITFYGSIDYSVDQISGYGYVYMFPAGAHPSLRVMLRCCTCVIWCSAGCTCAAWRRQMSTRHSTKYDTLHADPSSLRRMQALPVPGNGAAIAFCAQATPMRTTLMAAIPTPRRTTTSPATPTPAPSTFATNWVPSVSRTYPCELPEAT